MPGGRVRFEWIGEPPLYWLILFWITIGEFVVSWVLLATLSRWAQASPDPLHPVELHMKGGHSYYLAPRVGWFLNNELGIFFGLLGVLGLIMLIHRDKIQRVT